MPTIINNDVSDFPTAGVYAKTATSSSGPFTLQEVILPGKQYTSTNNTPNNTPLCWQFNYYLAHSSNKPVWTGYIRNSAVLSWKDLKMYIAPAWVTEDKLAAFKTYFPNDPKVQAFTLADLLSNMPKMLYRGENATGVAGQIPRGVLTPCQWARVDVVVDVVLAAIGGWGLVGKINDKALYQVGQLIEPSVSKIDEIAHVFVDANATALDKAKAIKDILFLIYSGGMFEAIYAAIMKSLEWYDMILYGIIGIAEVAGAFLTDGAELVAIIAVELAEIGFIISDAAKWKTVCAGTGETAS